TPPAAIMLPRMLVSNVTFCRGLIINSLTRFDSRNASFCGLVGIRSLATVGGADKRSCKEKYGTVYPIRIVATVLEKKGGHNDSSYPNGWRRRWRRRLAVMGCVNGWLTRLRNPFFAPDANVRYRTEPRTLRPEKRIH